jgi:uncharacterized protein
LRNLDIATVSLVIIDGINWGLVALADFDLVAELTGQKYGQTNKASKLVYGLVGAAALYQVAQNGGILGLERQSQRRNGQM